MCRANPAWHGGENLKKCFMTTTLRESFCGNVLFIPATSIQYSIVYSAMTHCLLGNDQLFTRQVCELPGDDLVSCVGGCCQNFHKHCLGGLPVVEADGAFTCENCKKG